MQFSKKKSVDLRNCGRKIEFFRGMELLMHIVLLVIVPKHRNVTVNQISILVFGLFSSLIYFFPFHMTKVAQYQFNAFLKK